MKISAGGIISVVVGLVLAFWAYVRMTSLAGQMHSWSPPFTEYELTTIAGGIGGLVLLIFGIGRSGFLRPTQGDGASRFCAKCGAKNLSTDAFCKECGAKVA